VVWQPHDSRLYWLYGELLNARGDVLGAADVLDNVVQFGGGRGWPELVAHRRVLLEAQDAYKEKQKALDRPQLLPGVGLPPAEASGSWLPDWRVLAVGFATGVIVTVLAGFQLREWRRGGADRKALRAGDGSVEG
jgi:hypothetical protein